MLSFGLSRQRLAPEWTWAPCCLPSLPDSSLQVYCMQVQWEPCKINNQCADRFCIKTLLSTEEILNLGRISDPGKALKVIKDFQRSEILFFFPGIQIFCTISHCHRNGWWGYGIDLIQSVYLTKCMQIHETHMPVTFEKQLCFWASCK